MNGLKFKEVDGLYYYQDAKEMPKGRNNSIIFYYLLFLFVLMGLNLFYITLG